MGSHLGCLLTSLKGAPIVHSSVEHRIEPPKIRWFAMLFIQTSVIGLSNYIFFILLQFDWLGPDQEGCDHHANSGR